MVDLGEARVSYAPTSSPRAPATLDDLIAEYATLYDLDYALFRAVIACESGFKPHAVGDGGTSFGLAQIHLPAHAHVSKEEATDPDFALRFMAQAWAAGYHEWWTCYRMLVR
jgi:soluble lytic murein transglycosylase-like protein